jgi:HEAT repeat protein
MNDAEMRAMLIEYMGNGFLENIISMLKQDSSLYRFIPDLLGDDNLRVRLGATALVEELVAEHQKQLSTAVPGIVGLLTHENPTIRGDAASVLGVIRDASAIDALRKCLHDDHPGVREIARDALAEMDR